jgi:hypothetical protein
MLIALACMGCVCIGCADGPGSLIMGRISCLSGTGIVLFSVTVRDRVFGGVELRGSRDRDDARAFGGVELRGSRDRDDARAFGGVELTRSRDALGDSVNGIGIGVAGRSI